jgi:zinc protease
MRNKITVSILLLLLLTAASALFFLATPSVDRTGPPEPRPLAKVDFPEYETRKLSNGLQVYAIQHREQPVITIRLVISAGAVNDPSDMPGVASFAANLLNQGTMSRSAVQIAEAIDQVGGFLEAGADMEGTTVTASVLKDDAALAFELMTDIVMNPAFDKDEIDRLRLQSLSSLSANMEDPDFIADAVFERVVYGLHPYGHLTGGTLQSIPRIKRENLAAFHDTYYVPNISALAIVGDLAAAESFELAEKWFGSWQQKDVPKAPVGQVSELMGRQIVILNKPDAVQTEIRVGHLNVNRKDPDYFNVLVSSYVLGGSAAGRLNTSLRVKRGLTYGAYATITPRKGPGTFYSVTDTRTEKTAEAVNLVLEEIQTLRGTEVPDQELNDAKSYIIGSFPLSIEVPADLATRLTTVFLYDLGDDYLATYRDRLAAVSSQDVLRVSRENISTDNIAIVLVGNADAFAKDLERLGTVRVLPMSGLDFNSPQLTR